MKLFDLFQKKPSQRENLNWAWLDTRPSLYKFLIEGLDEAGRLLPDHTILPDQKWVPNREYAHIPGARDGYRLLHTHLKAHPRQVEEIVEQFAHAVETFDDVDLRNFYEKLVQFDLMPSLELLMDALSRHPLDPARVFTFAAQLALHSADRQALKFALVVLSFYQLPEVRALALLFSQHDEFTYYSLLCLENFEDRFQSDCFMLAQCVYGWGRIHTVKALIPTLTADETEIADWLVREGFHSTVSDAYLAAQVVDDGRLLERLLAPVIDNGLLHASAILIAALLDPTSPSDDITHVKDGLTLVKEYLRHLTGNRQTHMHQPTLIRLKGILLSLGEPTENEFLKNLTKKGWHEDRELLRLLAVVLDDDDLFQKALDS
ncbi:MAG: hypothetical protein EOP10_03700 [Proteobacteria bacterium]|nr:MAG: hypothetical protein EOP10_03700 [Pseudomonadota bacterium]